MAKPTRIIALNLGSQTTGLAEFQAQPQGGLVLQNYRLREVLIDPAGEEIRHAQISASVARNDGRAANSPRSGQLRGLSAISLRAFREIASGRRGKGRADHCL